MKITVIDEGDIVGMWNALLTFGDVEMTSVKSMVHNVLKASAYRKITRLNIVGHGHRDVAKDKKGHVIKGEDHKPKLEGVSLKFGKDHVNLKNVKSYEKHFDRLTEKFDSKGFVHFCHCWAGQDVRLLAWFAKLWLVPVWAGHGKDANWAGVNLDGIYVRVTPDGKAKRFSSRP